MKCNLMDDKPKTESFGGDPSYDENDPNRLTVLDNDGIRGYLVTLCDY